MSDTNYAVIYDLHSHTTASDGCLTPEALVHRAVEMRVGTLAITDHDTTEFSRDPAEQTPGGSVMRQQSHGFPVNGLNERIIFRESECGQRAGIWAMMCPALEAFCLMT